MAVISTDRVHITARGKQLNFSTIWEHYLDAGFIYPAKLERLGPVLASIQQGWPHLLAASKEIFQFHFAADGSGIRNSICAFRDTDETYVIQHAVSNGQPLSMLEGIVSLHHAIRADPTVGCLGWYFRPENRWPSRLVRTINDVFPASLTTSTTRAYLVCEPGKVEPFLPRLGPLEEAPDDLEVEQFLVPIVGDLRVRSLGVNRHPLNLAHLDDLYDRAGLQRARSVVGVRRDAVLAGVALCYASNIPMNFSLLCNRVEIHVRPDVPDRFTVIRDLAAASIRNAARRGQPISTLLIDANDVPAALAGGFETTGKQYASVIWARESAEGWPSILYSLDRMYSRVMQRSNDVAHGTGKHSFPNTVDTLAS